MNSPLKIVMELYKSLNKEAIQYCFSKGSQGLVNVLTGEKAAVTGRRKSTGARMVDMQATQPLPDVLRAVKKAVLEAI